MTDPLAEVVALLQPQAPFSKRVLASAPWAVRRTELGQPFYFAVLEGGCQLHIDSPSGGDTLLLQTGDFVLIPAAHSFATASLDRRPPRGDEAVTTPIQALPGGARVGDPTRPVTPACWSGTASSARPTRPCWCRCCRAGSRHGASPAWPR